MLVTRITETIKRQAQQIADLREDRGRLQERAEYASARADVLAIEIEELKAAQASWEARRAPQTAEVSIAPSASVRAAVARWWPLAVSGLASVLALIAIGVEMLVPR